MIEKQFSNEQIIEALLEAGGNQTEAARILDCSRETIRLRWHEVQAVRDAIDAGLDDLADEAQNVIKRGLGRRERNAVYDSDGNRIGVELLEEPDKIAVDTGKWVLARLRKDVWSERQEVTGADGGDLKVSIEYVNRPIEE